MPLNDWKKTPYNSIGNTNVFGNADFNKLFSLLNGETDIANIELDSNVAFLQGRLKLRDINNVNEVVLNANTAQSTNATVQFPAITADDVVMLQNATQSAINKTYNLSNNTLTTNTPAQGDILKYDNTLAKYIRVARGAANQILSVTTDGLDIVWATPTSGTWNPANTETLTNKTVNLTNNTVTDTSTALGDLVKSNATKFVKFARGTTGQVLQSTSTDLQWGLVGDSNITTHTTSKISVLSKALLNTSIAYRDQNNDFGAFYQDIGGIAAPAAPAAGKRRLYVDSTTGAFSLKKSDGSIVSLEGSSYSPSSAEALTNKTIDSQLNTLKHTLITPVGRKTAFWYPISATAGTGFFNGFLSNTSSGSFTFNKDATVGMYNSITTGSSNTNQQGISTTDTFTCRQSNPTFQCKFRLPSVSGVRMDLGFTNEAGSGYPRNSDYLANQSGATLSFGTGRGDGTSFYLYTNNGGATSNATGPIATAVAGTIYTIEITFDNTNNRVQYSFNGGAVQNITSLVPAATTLMGIAWGIQTTTSSAKTLDVFGVDASSDK
jgi:hypothetical protein